MRVDNNNAHRTIISATTTTTTTAYRQALQQNPLYIQSEHFQLPFLRSELWNVPATAQRICSFLELKLKLFGLDKLCVDITVSDLSSSDDRRMIESGFFQLLTSQRDVAGRAIIIAMPMCSYPGMTMNSLMRAFYYISMLAVQDVETQRKGIILIGCNVGPHRQINRRAAWHVSKVRNVLPLKIVAIHYCYDDIRFVGMMTIAMLVSSASSRVRFRAHYGKTITDIQHKLTTFGIPDQCLPVMTEGEPKIKAFRTWIKIRKQQEDKRQQQQQSSKNHDENNNNTIVVIPGRVDVLLGRGRPIQEHFGNMRYFILLDHYQAAYDHAKKFEKKQVAQTVVDLIHKYQGRFLKQDGSGWVEVDAIVARDKVSQAFRARRISSSSVLEVASTNACTLSTNPSTPTTPTTTTDIKE